MIVGSVIQAGLSWAIFLLQVALAEDTWWYSDGGWLVWRNQGSFTHVWHSWKAGPYWDCPLEHLHITCPTSNSQSSWTSYIVTQGSQTVCSKRQEEEASSLSRARPRNQPIITSTIFYRSSSQTPSRFKEG